VPQKGTFFLLYMFISFASPKGGTCTLDWRFAEDKGALLFDAGNDRRIDIDVFLFTFINDSLKLIESLYNFFVRR
jgi:hypothetical protein